MLLSMILALLDDGHEAVYAAIERHLLFAQTAAIMEVWFSSLLALLSLQNCECSSAIYLFHSTWRLRGAKLFCVLLLGW